MARGRVARAAGEQLEAVVESLQECSGGKDGHTGGRELKREWKSVERLADSCDSSCVPPVQRELWADRARARDEERDRVDPKQTFDVDVLVGRLERWHRVDALGGKVERAAARR